MGLGEIYWVLEEVDATGLLFVACYPLLSFPPAKHDRRTVYGKPLPRRPQLYLCSYVSAHPVAVYNPG